MSVLSLSFCCSSGVDEIDAAVVRAAGPVPGEARLGVDRAIGLRRDEVETADMGGGDEDAVAEPGRPEPVRIDVDKQLAAALPALGRAADLHHLPAGPMATSP